MEWPEWYFIFFSGSMKSKSQRTTQEVLVIVWQDDKNVIFLDFREQDCSMKSQLHIIPLASNLSISSQNILLFYV